MKRKLGYYWIIYSPPDATEWTFAEFIGNGWWVAGLDDLIPESDLIVGDFISGPRPWSQRKPTASKSRTAFRNPITSGPT